MYTEIMIDRHTRIDWVDIAKGYGIILVIFGHIGSGIIENWIYTFHIPLFFFLSGFVFNNRYDIKTFFKKKTRSLIVPYFALCIPVILFEIAKALIMNRFSWAEAASLLLNFLLQRRFTAFWFIACLFWVSVIFYFLSRIIKNPLCLSMTILLIAVTGLVYNKLVGVFIPWNIDISLIMIVFFYVGFLVKQSGYGTSLAANKRRKLLWTIACFFINILSGYLNFRITGYKVDIMWGNYGYEPLMFLSAFFGIAGTVCFSSALSSRAIQYIGRNSMIYYLWHGSIVLPAVKYLLSVIHFSYSNEWKWLLQYSYKIFVLILTVLCLTLMNYLITKTKLRVVLNR